MTGYQQAILFLSGSWCSEDFLVRNIDKHYINAVAELAPKSRPYKQKHPKPNKVDYWVLKSRTLQCPAVADVSDWCGFCRGFIELQGILDTPTRCGRRSLRLRVYGQQDVLTRIMAELPATPKTIQRVRTQTGDTSAIYYQSRQEIRDIMDYIDGTPKNPAVWDAWTSRMAQVDVLQKVPL